MQPFRLIKSYLQWIITETILSMVNMNLWTNAETSKGRLGRTNVIDFYFIIIFFTDNNTMGENQDETTHTMKAVYELEPCDKVATLYVMQKKFDNPTFEALK